MQYKLYTHNRHVFIQNIDVRNCFQICVFAMAIITIISSVLTFEFD